MTVSNWCSLEKGQARASVCRKRDKAFHKVLLLPSDTAYDLQLLVDNEMVKPQYTSVVAIERDKVKAKTLEKKLKELKVPYQLITKDLVDVDLEQIIGKGLRFDFVYLDTCSQLSYSVLKWLTKVKRNYFKIFQDNAILSVAFCDYQRTGVNFMNSFMKFSKMQGSTYKHFDIRNARIFKSKAHTLEEIGDVGETEFSVKSFRTIRNIMTCLFGGATRAIRYKNDGARTTMSVLEYTLDHSMKATKFIEDFLAYYEKECTPVDGEKHPIKVKEQKAITRAYNKRPKLTGNKPLLVSYPLIKASLKDYKFKLAAWKMVATKRKMSTTKTREKVVEETLKYVSQKGTTPEITSFFQDEFINLIVKEVKNEPLGKVSAKCK